MVGFKLTEYKSLTGIDLLVRGNTISIHDGLKATSELVHLVIGRRLLRGLHAIQDGGNCRPATFLYIHVHVHVHVQEKPQYNNVSIVYVHVCILIHVLIQSIAELQIRIYKCTDIMSVQYQFYTDIFKFCSDIHVYSQIL